MQSDDPAFLTVGTEVSAKFKGAFCEAKVKRFSKSVKCKVVLKEAPFSTEVVDHSQIKGILEVNQSVDVFSGKEFVKGVIQHVKDNSIYTVVFNDGDERQLRRTQLCLKGAKHFDDSVNLDTMPLYNPEAFSSPVITDGVKGGKAKSKKRKLRRRAAVLSEETRREAITRKAYSDAESDSSGDSDDSSHVVDSRNSLNARYAASAGTSRCLRRTSSFSRIKVKSRSFRFPNVSPSSTQLRGTSNEIFVGAEASGSEQNSSEEKEERKKWLTSGSAWKFYGLRQNRENKFLSKMSLARTRKKRPAATAAAVALARDINYAGTDSDEDEHSEEEEKVQVKERGRPRKQRATKNISSGDDELGKITESAKANGKKRQRMNDEEEVPSKKSKGDEKAKKLQFDAGMTVAVYDEGSRKCTWVPAVVVSSKAFATFAKGNATVGKNEVPLRSFRDAKYFASVANSVTTIRSAALKNLDPAHRGALEKASCFLEKGTLPMNWERNQIYGDEIGIVKARRESSASINEVKKDAIEDKKKEKQKVSKTVSIETSSSSESSEEDEGYGEDRDQFTAQLYKFHEERGTPINRAPILGGKDIDMFRLYKVVQDYGGKKRVTEHNMWRKILVKLHLEGCPGANPLTVRKAYSRYLDHFSTFWKNLGVSSWGSTSSRSIRQIRLTDRDADQMRRKRMAELAEKKKEQEKLKREHAKEEKHEAKAKKGHRGESKSARAVKMASEAKKEKPGKEEKEIKKENECESYSSSTDFPPEPPFSIVKHTELVKEVIVKQEEKTRADEKDSTIGSASLQDIRIEDKPKEQLKTKEKEKEHESNKVKGKVKRSVSDVEDAENKTTDSKPTKDEAVAVKAKSDFDHKPKDLSGTDDLNGEQQDFIERKRKKQSKTDSAERKPGTAEKNEEVETKKQGKQIGLLKKLHRKKIRSESDVSEGVGERVNRVSPSVISSTPSTSAVDRQASASESEEEGNQRTVRKRGRRKSSFRERSTVSTTSGSSDHTVDSAATRESEVKTRGKHNEKKKDENAAKTVHSTVFTRFYQGQNVRAHHLDKWYDARVITANQPLPAELADALLGFEKRLKEDAQDSIAKMGGGDTNRRHEAAYLWLYNRLKELQKRVKCFVHYLGWNSRYDSWAVPSDMKVLEKDQQAAEDVFRKIAPQKMDPACLEKAFLWRPSTGIPETATENIPCSDVPAFGNVRPRRLSATHQEPSTSNVEEQNSSLSPSSAGFLAPGVGGVTPATGEKSHQKQQHAGLPKQHSDVCPAKSSSSVQVSSVKGEERCEPDLRDSSLAPAEENLSQSSTESLISSRSSLYPDVEVVHVTEAKTFTPPSQKVPVQETTSNNIERQPPPVNIRTKALSSVITEKNDARSSEDSTTTVAPSVSIAPRPVAKEPETKAARLDLNKGKRSSNESTVTKRKRQSSEAKSVVENVTCEVKLSKGMKEMGDSAEPTGEENTKHVTIELPLGSHESASLSALVRKKKIHRALDEIKVEVPAASFETPVLKIKNEVEKEPSPTAFDKLKMLPPSEVSENESREGQVETPLSSPSDTTQVKQPVSYPASITNDFEVMSGDAIDVNDDECTSPKDSFHALKLRLLQKMEADSTLEDAEDELGLQPIGRYVAGDPLLQCLQDRLQQLRDLYHSARVEQAQLDRRWRRTNEKRRQREREQKKREEQLTHALFD